MLGWLLSGGSTLALLWLNKKAPAPVEVPAETKNAESAAQDALLSKVTPENMAAALESFAKIWTTQGDQAIAAQVERRDGEIAAAAAEQVSRNSSGWPEGSILTTLPPPPPDSHGLDLFSGSFIGPSAKSLEVKLPGGPLTAGVGALPPPPAPAFAPAQLSSLNMFGFSAGPPLGSSLASPALVSPVVGPPMVAAIKPMSPEEQAFAASSRASADAYAQHQADVAVAARKSRWF